MFCPSCGTKADDGANFCEKCGAAFGARRQERAAPKPKRRWLRFMVFGCLGVVVLFAGSIAAFVFKNLHDNRVHNEMMRAAVVSLDSAMDVFRAAADLPQLDSTAARAEDGRSRTDLGNPIQEESDPSPMRANQCVSFIRTSDPTFGFANGCKYPVEIAFCADSAPLTSPAASFQCEEEWTGRVTLGPEGMIAVQDLKGAKQVVYGACNATESGPLRLWKSEGLDVYMCSRRRVPPIEPLGTGAARAGTPANTVERLAECRAIAGVRKLAGAARVAFLDACVAQSSLEATAFGEPGKTKP